MRLTHDLVVLIHDGSLLVLQLVTKAPHREMSLPCGDFGCAERAFYGDSNQASPKTLQKEDGP